MITFRVSFLLSFSLHSDALKARGKQKDKKDAESTNEETPNAEFDSKNIRYAAHIQYELIPNRCKYSLDVICWGPLAKIITNDGSMLLFTVIKRDKIWVPVSIEHYLESLSVSDLKSFQSRIIDFTVVNCFQKVGGQFKFEKVTVRKSVVMDDDGVSFKTSSIFRSFDKDLRSDDDNPKLSVKNYIESMLLVNSNFLKSETVSWLDSSHDYDMFYDIIKKIYSGENIRINELINTCGNKEKNEQETKEQRKSKKAEKTSTKSKNKNQQRDVLTIRVPAEVFFTESYAGTYRLTTAGNFVNDVFIIVSASNLLTRAQKLTLKPLVVKILYVENFPREELSDFDKVYARYGIPDVFSCITDEKAIDKTVHFDEAHVHFMDNIPSIRLIEGIQTKRFYVEIFGKRRTTDEPSKCGLFGQYQEDFDFSKVRPNFEQSVAIVNANAPILLAVSVFDISSLVDNVWDFRETGQCHAPNLTISAMANYAKIDCSNFENVNDINLRETYVGKSLIQEARFLELGTAVTVDVYLMAPQSPSLIYHHAPDTFKKIFFVVEDETSAAVLYNRIFIHNQTKLNRIKEKQIKDINKTDILTGFVLDNGGNFFFYVEGLSTGFILNLWHILEKTDTDQRYSNSSAEDIHSFSGKIFFNTDYAFETRLYEQFITIGLYVINLKIPFQDILAIPKIYSRNKIPQPCLRALTKLCSLFHAKYYKSILQQNLLPLPQELISLDVEWGVPNRWVQLEFE